jgi:Leucine-rich repeat (LRR) protein
LDPLINLFSLSLNNNIITEIKGLNTLKNLRILRLNNNKITEIKGLVNLKKLTTLNLSNNQIEQIKDPQLPFLYFYNLDNNNIPQLQLRNFYRKHRVFKYFNYF